MFAKQSLNEKKSLGTLIQEYDLFIEEIDQLAARCNLTTQDVDTLQQVKTRAAETSQLEVDVIQRDINLPSRYRTAATREVSCGVRHHNVSLPEDTPCVENQMNRLNENLITEGKKNIKRGIQALFRSFETLIDEREAFMVKYQLDDAAMRKIENRMEKNKNRLVEASSLVVAIMSHGKPGSIKGEYQIVI